jgi:hypothetical protein
MDGLCKDAFVLIKKDFPWVFRMSDTWDGWFLEKHGQKQKKKTWILGEFEGRWSTRHQDGEWV